MRQSPSIPAASKAVIADLARPQRVGDLHPIGARFVYSLRLIALHERAKRDPVPELAVRLGSVEIAAKALRLAQIISAIWPENIHVSRFCCGLMSHDEATIGTVVECAAMADRTGFEAAIAGLIRPDRHHRLWDGALGYIAAESRAS